MQNYVAWLTLCSDHNVKLATLSRILDPAQHSDWMLLLMDEMEILWKKAETMSAKAIAEDMSWPEITVRRAISDDRLLFYQALRINKETGEQIACDWEAVMTLTRADQIKAARRTRKVNGKRRDAAGLLTAMGVFYCGYCGKTVKSWNNSNIRKDAYPKSRMIDHNTVDEKVIKNIFSTLPTPTN